MRRIKISSFFHSVVKMTAIADMLYRGRSVRAGTARMMNSALGRSLLSGRHLLGLISVTKTNGAASNASRVHVAMAALQRRSSNDN